MRPPVNFDSPTLDGVLADWLGALREFAVQAVVVLGPDPFGEAHQRQVLAVHPPPLAEAAQALAASRDFGANARGQSAPLVSWQQITPSELSGDGRWRMLWRAHGYQTVVRVGFALPAGRAFECFMFSPREFHDRTEAAALVWAALNFWPVIQHAVASASCPLSRREIECLELAFEGRTARESAVRLGCTDRTVTYHLSNAMAKLKVDSKLAAIQRACWLGAI